MGVPASKPETFSDAFPWHEVPRKAGLGFGINTQLVALQVDVGAGVVVTVACRKLALGVGRVDVAYVYDKCDVGLGHIGELHCMAGVDMSIGVGTIRKVVYHSEAELTALACAPFRLQPMVATSNPLDDVCTDSSFGGPFPWGKVRSKFSCGAGTVDSVAAIKVNVGVGKIGTVVARTLSVGTGTVDVAYIFEEVKLPAGVIHELHCIAGVRVDVGAGIIRTTVYHSEEDLAVIACAPFALQPMRVQAVPVAQAIVVGIPTASSSTA